MEKPPSGEIPSVNPEEKELSFEEQLSLAKNLFQSVDDRNLFIKRQGGFDTFAEAGQYVEGMRETYDRMEDAVTAARAEFDRKVADKKTFIKNLEEAGDEKLAVMISSMFGVPKEKVSKGGILSRVFGKKEQK